MSSNTHKSAVSESNGTPVLNPSEKPFPNPSKNPILKTTNSNYRKPIENNAEKPENSTVVHSPSITPLEIDYSAFANPRLTQLAKNRVEKVKPLRSVLFFIMCVTFDADLWKARREADSLFPWQFTIYTRTDADPSKFFA